MLDISDLEQGKRESMWNQASEPYYSCVKNVSILMNS